MKLILKEQQDILLVELNGQLGAYQAPMFEKALLEAVYKSEKIPYLILDCSQLQILDSTGLGALLRMTKNVQNDNGLIFLTGLREQPRLVLETTQTIKLFQCFQTVQTAIDSLKQIRFARDYLEQNVGA